MAYKGSTKHIDCSRGGMVHNPNLDAVGEHSMLWPSYNVNLHRGGREKRGGTAKIYANPFSGGSAVMGLHQYPATASNIFTMALTVDGRLYKNGTDTVKTGLSTTSHPSMEVAGGKLYYTDGVSVPQWWDGVAPATTAFTAGAADWVTDPPVQFVRHGRENSQRLWGINRRGIYYSVNGTFADFTGSGSGYIYLDTGDYAGPRGAVKFGKELFVMGNEITFRILDADTDLTKWGFETVQWKGGAAHWRLIIPTENDCYCMMANGEFYSLTSWFESRDYKKSSVTRPSFMHEWIKDFVDLTKIEKFHGKYDPTMRAIKLWVVMAGSTNPGMCLVFYPDRPLEEAWAPPHCNLDHPSGYAALCSAVVKSSNGKSVVYTGDSSGHVWELEKGEWNDDGKAYYGGYRTPNFSPVGDPRVTCHINSGRIVTKAQGQYVANINTWIDGKAKKPRTVPLVGSGGTLDTFVLDEDALGGPELIDNRYKIGGKGMRVQTEIYNNVVNQGFFVSRQSYDFKPSGRKE